MSTPTLRIGRFVALLLAFTAIVACKPQNDPARDQETTAPKPVARRIEPTDKILVVYFSRIGEQIGISGEGKVERIYVGNTAILAQMIAQKTGAELFEVKPDVDRYPNTFRALTSHAKRELDSNARPQFALPAPDLRQYDVIFFGAPVWWGDWPMIMYSFFEANPLTGKIVVPFNTNEGSDLSGFDSKLSKAYPECDVLQGFAAVGGQVQKRSPEVEKRVDDWLSNLGIAPSSQSEEDANDNDPR